MSAETPIGSIQVALAPPAAHLVDQAEREYREAVRAEALAMRSRAAAGARLFAARRALLGEELAELADENGLAEVDVGTLRVPCRDCLQTVPAYGGGHELVMEAGDLPYARCGGGGL